jgi:hypothetical protein
MYPTAPTLNSQEIAPVPVSQSTLVSTLLGGQGSETHTTRDTMDNDADGLAASKNFKILFQMKI